MSYIFSHPSLQPRDPEYSVGRGRVLKGRTVLAWIATMRGTIYVSAPGGRLIGTAESQAQAMLMAIRDHEAGQ